MSANNIVNIYLGHLLVDYNNDRNILLFQETGNLHSERGREKQMLKLAAYSVKSQKSCYRKKRPLKKVKSIELRAGTLYNNCDCYRRNGLQHDCPRTLCGSMYEAYNSRAYTI